MMMARFDVGDITVFVVVVMVVMMVLVGFAEEGFGLCGVRG